ncbi:TPA: hypothetical protein ACW96C_004436 [Yersinia enterocolitica]|uniref:hypothetical protein n=1 Tax=Yersinia enterocolitica TaxID=630 RepID=UPI002963040B|nr:hypothetical protein [Yersinia enterocolitica]HDL6753112.1 hypothetical protein [Yersinia enterocolitica]HDL7879509.1 hypothetical protein [Yersinia enterocolitica]HDL7892088.1 hypothetical protein [Yersinia enterocolitica]HDM8317591.1 hypothetical protein [Yersinia enterocolitica]
MADENTGLVVIDIKPEQAPTLYVAGGLDSFLEYIREMTREVPDVTTKKGRDRIGSIARMIGSSKKAVEEPGRDYLRSLKDPIKPAEKELKRFVDECDDIRDAFLKPRIEWEAEQERLAAESAYAAMWQEAHEMDARFTIERAEKLAAEIEVAHEMALLMNDAFDRDAKEKAEEVERLRKAHEEFIANEAAEKAKREAEEKAKRDIEAAEQRERDAKLAQERAEREKMEATELAERNRIAAEQKAEREKQEAIAAEQRKAQEEADRIKREAKQKEDARLAEEKRIADEAAARAANVEHKRTINQQAVADLVAAGIPEECAVKCVKAIAKGQVSAIAITY